MEGILSIVFIIAAFIMFIASLIIFITASRREQKEAPTLEPKDQNEIYKLYLQVDPAKSRKLIEDLIDYYVDEYALYHFTVQETQYIKSDEIEEMIKTITETMYINLSDFYAFHIKLLINVKAEEDILGYIRDKVKTKVILYAADMNKPT